MNSKNPQKNRYFISFPFGLAQYMRKMLRFELTDVKVEEVFSTYAIFATGKPMQKVKKLPFANSVYLYIKKFTHANVISPESQLKWAVESPTFVQTLQKLDFDFNTYRIFGQKNGRTISLPVDFKQEFIAKLEYFERLKFDNQSCDVEIWFIESNQADQANSDSLEKRVGLCGIKISSHPDYQQSLQKGELRPEIAYFLNFAADPVKGGVLLDPFAGSGAIALAAAKNFDYQKIYAGEKSLTDPSKSPEENSASPSPLPSSSKSSSKSPPKSNANASPRRHEDKSITWLEMDGTKMAQMEKNSVDRIVSDPPWGIYNSKLDIADLYDAFLEKSTQILKNDGQMLLLLGGRALEKFDEVGIAEKHRFQEVERIRTSTWGKEAFVVKLILAKE
jgi:hypothetical protein